MIIRRSGFNIYLLPLLLSLLMAGCRTEEGKIRHQYSAFTVHLETRSDQKDSTKLISVLRSAPMLLNIEKEPFLNESMVKSAKVMDVPQGGFVLQIELTKSASLTLEQYSARSLGKRFAIYGEFGQQTARNVFPHSRWLAAPVIDRRISNGTLVFTPDADRKEAEDFALGLNNLARVRKSRSYIDED
jgi:hypothetical protein